MRYVDEFRYVGRSYGPLFESDYDYESNESTEGNENDLMRAHESRAVERAGECASAQAQTGEQFADDLLVLKDIFSDMYLSEALDEDRKEKVVVIGGISRVRRDFSLPSEIGERKIGGGGRKEPVKTFSRKSRRNLMVKLAMMVIDFLFWQDFTFADDVMAGLSISQRAKYSTKVMKAFKEWLEREGYKIHGVWKREWRPRLSGVLKGQYVPHFHLLYFIEGISSTEYFKLAVLFAHKWVEFTKTKEHVKALKVGVHRKSYRLIESRKQANQYVSDRKYISKYGEFISNESIGRNWGYLGKPIFAAEHVFYLFQSEMVLLRRILRKFVKKSGRGFRRLIAEKYSRFTIFINELTVYRILNWIAQTQMLRAVKSIPF